MPKSHRGAGTGLLRTHSRSSSTSKLPSNLQFTQKDLPPPKLDKAKKNGYGHESHLKAVTSFARVNSGQRVQSKEQIQPSVLKRATASQHSKSNGAKSKSGFHIPNPGDEDEDEWVSSESGAATPSNRDSDGAESESDATPDAESGIPSESGCAPKTARPANAVQADTPILPRVDTARPSDFVATALNPMPPTMEGPRTRTPTLPPIQTEELDQLTGDGQTQNHLHSDLGNVYVSRSEIASPSPQGSRPANKRYSSTRPPSIHSVTGRGDQPLRPHPLIRGHSFGQAYPLKPVPLAPLTVMPSEVSSTPPPANAFDAAKNQLSTSPSSLKNAITSPASDDASTQQRRTSISSARSVATLPVHSNLREAAYWGINERQRTSSTISQSSSSAALSSLAHLPTVTRPPSPQPISFFPPVNPHANIEGIHPLLPSPYLNNHLTVLARRTPIKESFERVIQAKRVRS